MRKADMADGRESNGKSSEQSDGEMSFAEMFDQDFTAQDHLQTGQKIRAEIVRISQDWIFLDVGGKSEGYLSRNELVDRDGQLKVKEGEAIEVYFLSEKQNELLFTTVISGASARAHLEEIHRNNIPVEGLVVKEVKGGFEVQIAGSVRAFCPFSQMDVRRIENNEEFLSQTFPFKITEYGEGGEKYYSFSAGHSGRGTESITGRVTGNTGRGGPCPGDDHLGSRFRRLCRYRRD
ncbi:S1 RNA-binding domain-containing protein [Thermodesulfobacteriota bacterium]